MKRGLLGRRALFAVFALAGVTASSQADVTGSFTLFAQNEFGSGSYEVNADQFFFNPSQQTWTWALANPVNITSSGGTLLATLTEADVEFIADPVITMGFTVVAGNSTTIFTLTSALLSFPNIPIATGQASAGMTLTDSDQDGATLLDGSGQPGKMYGAYINGFIGAGTNFASLVSNFSTGAGGTSTNSESFGFAPAGSVNDMSTQFKFTLSANDLASGTSRFEVLPVPEPASMAAIALGLGSLVLRRRRR